MEANYFRPQVKRELQRPLQLAAIKLGKHVRDVASEGIRSFCELVLEEKGGDGKNPHDSLVKVALATLRDMKPLYLDEGE